MYIKPFHEFVEPILQSKREILVRESRIYQNFIDTIRNCPSLVQRVITDHAGVYASVEVSAECITTDVIKELKTISLARPKIACKHEMGISYTPIIYRDYSFNGARWEAKEYLTIVLLSRNTGTEKVLKSCRISYMERYAFSVLGDQELAKSATETIIKLRTRHSIILFPIFIHLISKILSGEVSAEKLLKYAKQERYQSEPNRRLLHISGITGIGPMESLRYVLRHMLEAFQ